MKDISNNYILSVEHIQKSFRRGKKLVLRDVSFNLESGECIGILGANGCGKSTLLSILAGISQPDSGSLIHNGNDCFTSHKFKFCKNMSEHIGYVAQECPLMEELTALDNLKLWYCDSPLSLENELSNGTLAILGISDFLNTKVKNMSGGMKKRLSIGCSIAKKPQILILDEPGAALDIICKERIEVYLKNHIKNNGSIIIATHEEREIALCDRLFVLKNGILEPFEFDGNMHKLVSAL